MRHANLVVSSLLVSSIVACAGCSQGTVHAYNGYLEPVTVTIDGRSQMIQPGSHTYWRTNIGPADTITASTSAGPIESVHPPAEAKGEDLVYNIGGRAPLLVVDYAGLYECDDGRPSNLPPVVIKERLEGRTFYVAPRSNFLDRSDVFPEKTLGCQRSVLRVEERPAPSLRGSHTEEYMLAQSAMTELMARGIINAPRQLP